MFVASLPVVYLQLTRIMGTLCTNLPRPLQMRPLSSTDYALGHLSVLSVLTSTPDMGQTAYTNQFAVMKSTPNTYYTLVIVNKPTDSIVGVGCVFMERKFLRNLGRVGHIEDIAVDKKVQGAKLGLRIIQALTAISEAQGAYKTILNCSTANIRKFRVLPSSGWDLPCPPGKTPIWELPNYSVT